MALQEDPQLIKEAIRKCRRVIRFQKDELRKRDDAYKSNLETRLSQIDRLISENDLLKEIIAELTVLQGDK